MSGKIGENAKCILQIQNNYSNFAAQFVMRTAQLR